MFHLSDYIIILPWCLYYSRTEQKGNMHSGNPYVAGNPSNVVKERLMFQGTV